MNSSSSLKIAEFFIDTICELWLSQYSIEDLKNSNKRVIICLFKLYKI